MESHELIIFKIKSALEKSIFNKFIFVKQTQTITSIDSQPILINNFTLEGSVSYTLRKELIEFKDLIDSICTTESIRIDNIWKIDVSYIEGDILHKIHYIDINGDEGIIDISSQNYSFIHIWSMHNKKFNSELNFIEMSNIIKDLGITTIKQYMVCGDSNYEVFTNFVKHKTWDLFVNQYISNNIFEDLCIKNSPCLIIVDCNGIIKYKGDPYSIDIIQTTKNISENNEVIKHIENNKDNLWWVEMNNDSKKEIVIGINENLRELGLFDISFIVVEEITYFEFKNSYQVIPIISGFLDSFNEIYLLDLIKDISDSLGFVGINKKISYFNEISKEVNIEVLKAVVEKEEKGV